ncbi:hypothetical protein BDZ89DRAFT_1070763, partial [Hymenopellis radicata]
SCLRFSDAIYTLTILINLMLLRASAPRGDVSEPVVLSSIHFNRNLTIEQFALGIRTGKSTHHVRHVPPEGESPSSSPITKSFHDDV